MTAGFGLTSPLQSKGRGNIVTAVDLSVEQTSIAILSREYPDHRILSEETMADTSYQGWLWIVDPVDGTRNYASGIPNFSYNIALCYRSEPVLGLTYDPLRREEFFAVKGGGAYLNERPLQASLKESLQAAVVGVEMGYDDQLGKRLLALLHHLWPGMQSIRIIGSAALAFAYAAAGRFDLFIDPDLSPWDVAPGILLVQEAGGIVTDLSGAPATIYSKSYIAGGPQVHADFARLSATWAWR